MKILYIFPHPDDESFGPAPAIRQQLKRGHDVYLLTLTKGGATRQRHKYNLSIEEMGEVRAGELKAAADVIGITGLIVTDLPDSGMKEMDPREIEDVIKEQIMKIRPDVVVTYAVHGISGFHDHLVCHNVVKRVYCELRGGEGMPRRLALYTLSPDTESNGHFRLNTSKAEEIDCIVATTDDEVETGRKALDCYQTYLETIENTGIKEMVSMDVSYEFFQETFAPPVDDICFSLGA
ncbi:MAG: PIG-L deacetylase family protein [Cyclonatronaceae bacterium]